MSSPKKFKAWDKRLNEWLGADKWFIDPATGKVHAWSDTGLEGYTLEHVELVQFTGLKDKNDVEIYEGDIVSYIVNSRGDRNVGTEVKIIVDENKGTMFMYPAVNSTTEVIGNIYKNKELLDGKK